MVQVGKPRLEYKYIHTCSYAAREFVFNLFARLELM